MGRSEPDRTSRGGPRAHRGARPAQEPWRARIRWLLVAGWAAFVLYVAVGSLPQSPVWPSMPERLVLRGVLPEGWAFFTRDPREAQAVAYRPVGDGWRRAIPANAHPSHLFGLRRTARVAGIELGELVRRVPEDAWSEPATTTRAQAAASLRPVRLPNRAARPGLCGPVLVEIREPVPWAWARATSVRMPARRVLLEVECDPAV